MYIRKENAADYETVYSVVKQAFAGAEHADGNEQDLVEALRSSKAYIPELSLVAELDGKIAGHIMFTKAMIGGKEVLALAPLSVLPEYQRKGIGKALYPKAGYVPAQNYGIRAPFDVPKENFMVYIINETGADIHGTIKYAKEFGID